MQRELFFDNNGDGTGKGNIRFRTIWTAIGFIPPQGMSKPAEILRRESSIARKLKSVSLFKIVDDEQNVQSSKQRVLKDGDQKLILEQSEIELIRQRIESFPFWNPLAEEPVSEVYDWLNSGKEIENATK